MKTKIIISAALVAAFLMGSLFHAYVRPALSKASSTSSEQPTVTGLTAPSNMPPANNYPSPDTPVSAYNAPAGSESLNSQPERPRSAAPRVTSHGSVRRYRPTRDQVLIVAGSVGAGAGIGALAGGKKGAGIGALSGGAAGLAYDLLTRH
jgi:hypothetical protein